MRAVRQASMAVLLSAVAGLACGNNGDGSTTTLVTSEPAHATTTMPPATTGSTTTTSTGTVPTEATTTMPPATTSSTTATSTGTVASTTETPAGGAGMLRPDGVAPFGFGSAADEVQGWLIDQLGSPDAAVVEPGQRGWPLMSCAERRFAYWAAAGLTVGFTDHNSDDVTGLPDCDDAPHLAGWYLIADEVPWFAPDHGTSLPAPQSLRLTTADGIGLGSSAGDLRAVFPAASFGEQDIDTYNPAVFRATDTMWGRVAWNATSDIQNALNEHGASLVVDGILGPDTEAALVEFQTSRGITENGTVGPRTLAELEVSVPDDAPIVYLAAGTWDWDY